MGYPLGHATAQYESRARLDRVPGGPILVRKELVAQKQRPNHYLRGGVRIHAYGATRRGA
jgi:hypothetical protein